MDETVIRSGLIRSDQVLHAQLTSPEVVGCGSAYCDARFPLLADANQLRDVLLGSVDPVAAFALVEDHFAARGVRCLRWAASPDQPLAPLDAHLTSLGWIKTERAIFGEQQLPATLLHPDDRPVPGLRILPARAMRCAYHRTFTEATDESPIAAYRAQQADAANERLDDANYDAFVATLEGEPVARGALLLAGDIGRVHDLFVASPARGRGIAHALLRHLFQLAYRLRPRVVLADAPIGETAHAVAATRLLTTFGLEAAGSLIEWTRSS